MVLTQGQILKACLVCRLGVSGQSRAGISNKGGREGRIIKWMKPGNVREPASM